MTSKATKCHAHGAVVLACAATLVLTGCGSDLGGALQSNAVTPYVASSAFSPTGHHVADLGNGRYRVTATGSASTPKARVEKMAMARAAEFGVEQQSKYFQTSVPNVSIRCGKREYIEKGEKKYLPVRGYTVAEVDVVYANTPADPSYRPVKDTSSALLAELQAETVAEEARQAATAEVSAQCGA